MGNSMDGSKILLTERLRAEQRWPEASKRKDELVKSLRAEGMRRAKAAEAAWERIEAEYPPLEPTAPTPMPPTETVAAVDDETFAGLLKIVQGRQVVPQKRYQRVAGSKSRTCEHRVRLFRQCTLEVLTLPLVSDYRRSLDRMCRSASPETSARPLWCGQAGRRRATSCRLRICG